MFSVVLSYYYLPKNFQFIICLFISCLVIRLKSGSTATALFELLVRTGGMLVEPALFVLGLLCFHCTFSVKIAITNIWRDKTFSVLIQTMVQASWFFTR